MVAYCRVSTNKEDQLNSLETQKEFFEQYAKKEGFNLIKIYADEGISGTQTKKRKAFLKMMSDAEKGLFQLVAVKDISRLARNTVDFLQSIRKLKSNGIQCKFVTSNLTSEDGELTLTILATVAQEESANTSKRIKMKVKMNAEKGIVPSFVFGYDRVPDDPFNLTINEKEAEIVKRIFKLYTAHDIGGHRIANILNDEGVKSKRGNKWSQTTVQGVLRHEIYTGKIINGREEVQDFLTGIRVPKDRKDWQIAEKPELRLIDDETFRKVGEILERRREERNLTGKRHSSKHLFSSLIKCKTCGHTFIRKERTFINTYIDWRCWGRGNYGMDSCCNKTKLPEADLIGAIEEYFVAVLNDKPNALKGIVSDFNKQYKTKDENIVSEQDLQKKLKKLQSTRQKYLTLFEDDLISKDEMQAKMKTVNADIKKAETELHMIARNINKGEMLEEILEATFKDIESVTSVADMTNAQLKRIIEKIVADECGEVEIYLKMLTDIGLDETVPICYNRTTRPVNRMRLPLERR
jgi:DNA invertase Pin-like site-specific DNA recombinase